MRQSPFRPLAIEGLSAGVRKFHHRELLGLQGFCNQFVDETATRSLDKISMDYMQMLYCTSTGKSATGWLPQTFHRRLLNLAGALAALPCYVRPPSKKAVPFSITIKPCTEVQSLLKRIQLLAAQAQPTGQRAATWEEISAAIEQEYNLPTQIALLLMWLTAARIGDVLKLKRKSIRLHGTNFLDVTFEDGKGVVLRKGKYSVHTCVPESHRPLLAKYLKGLRPDDLLVPAVGSQPLTSRLPAANKALKRVDKTITTRGIRRGALQAMAMGSDSHPPVPLETLMEYAGHLRPETTRRYLDWGRLFGEAAMRQRGAAANLSPSL